VQGMISLARINNIGDLLLGPCVIKHLHDLFDAAIRRQVVAPDRYPHRVLLECTSKPPHRVWPCRTD
jgi:hypothetical protein